MVNYGSHLPSLELADPAPTILVQESSPERASSAPVLSTKSPKALACLQRCASALILANQRMNSLSDTVKRLSIDRNLENLADKPCKMAGGTRQCHGCHGPCDATHKGYQTGADRCPLDHYEGCEGGIEPGFDRIGQKWRGCPSDHVFMEDDLSDGFTGSGSYMEDGITGDQCILNNFGAMSLGAMGIGASNLEPKLPAAILPPTPASTSPIIVMTSVATSVFTSTTTPATVALTSSGVFPAMATGGVEVSAEVNAARNRLQALKKQREDLELLAVLQKEEEQEAAENRKLHEQLRSQKSVRPKVVGEAASRLRVRNQPEDNQTPENGFYNGLTIPEIRKVPGLGHRVEARVDKVRDEIPSLSRRPNAPLGGPRQQHQQLGVQRQQQIDGQRQQHQLGGRARPVKQQASRSVVFDPAGLTTYHQQSYAHDLIGFDDDPLAHQQPLQHVGAGRPQVDYLTGDPESDPSDEEDHCQELRLVYRRDKNGIKYRNWEPAQVEEPKVLYEWVTDVRSGRQYKRPVASKSQGRAHRSCSSSARFIPPQPQQNLERAPTFFSLSNSEREGKSEKTQNIVDWAKKCPVLWAEKVNFESMNAIVWLWGYFSELLETRTTNPTSLDGGVLEAKLQHALCVLEVCATHSEKTDFDSQGWRIARLYAHKVQAQLDRGLVTWTDFSEFKSNPHPSELIAAKQELDQKKTFKRKQGEEVKEVRLKAGEKPLCTTWNVSKVEGKCDWQVRNPDRGRCNRRHECSYCIDKGHGSTYHQKSFCARRTAAGDA